jgi:NFU1 iron-sulfur cluster scaffold homolog, mitochondrial
MSLIQFEHTPNPDAVRVDPGVPVAHGSPRHFTKGDVVDDPLAAKLLEIDGVVRVLLGRDFVTVVREGPQYAWDRLRPGIVFALADFLENPTEPRDARAEADRELLTDIEQQIEEVLERWVRPLISADGGEVVLVHFDPADGTAWVRMDGACGGCPSSTLTLKRSIEQAVRKWVPEVKRVQATSARPQEHADPKARFRNWLSAKFGSASGPAS